MVTKTLSELSKDLTAEELMELKAAESRQPVMDEDSPAMTMEQLLQFKSINHKNRTKPTVSLRVSQDTLKKAKQYGKGYTSFLSRLLDVAINNEEIVRQCI